MSSCASCNVYSENTVNVCEMCNVVLRILPSVVHEDYKTLRCNFCKISVNPNQSCGCGILTFSKYIIEKEFACLNPNIENTSMTCYSNNIGCQGRGHRYVSYCENCVDVFKNLSFELQYNLMCNICNTSIHTNHEDPDKILKCDCGGLQMHGRDKYMKVQPPDGAKYTNVSKITVKRILQQ